MMTVVATSPLETAEVEKFVANQVHVLGADTIDVLPTSTLEDLGLDSLDVVELCQSARKTYSIELSPKDFADALTVKAVVEVIVHASQR